MPLLSKGDHETARDRFAELMESEVDTPQATQQKRLARVGRATSLIELGAFAEAQADLEELIEKHDPQESELFGRAYNALGKCHLRADRPQDALLAFLHVDLLFYSESETHAEALYHLAKLWQSFDKTERAASARSLLADRYAGTKWAKLE